MSPLSRATDRPGVGAVRVLDPCRMLSAATLLMSIVQSTRGAGYITLPSFTLARYRRLLRLLLLAWCSLSVFVFLALSLSPLLSFVKVTLFWCRGCGRYQRPPYVHVELESREMLALCLQKIKGLNKEVKLVDASFIWTEPHSKRIKVKLTIQKEVFHGAILQQMFVVEFVIQNQQCTGQSRTPHLRQEECAVIVVVFLSLSFAHCCLFLVCLFVFV